MCEQTAKVLAEAVIPNEYGINPEQKLRIGSKICNALLGKLLADLGNMREESLATAVCSSCLILPLASAIMHMLTATVHLAAATMHLATASMHLATAHRHLATATV